MIAAYLLAMAASVVAQPAATIDLRTDAGIQAVDTQWRYADARIVEVDFKGPDANGKPNGAPIRTFDIAPHAGVKNFDDAAWEVIGPSTLEGRRSNGRLAFNWYRLNVRIPDRVDGFSTAGSTVVF
jgi:hypothetical protein